ncbi:MAG: NotI family restriction endonuclease [Armatimonadota bacterium]
MNSETRSETYGIGEWYGELFTKLTADQRKSFAKIQELPRSDQPDIPCPFQSHEEETVQCTKAGGVCSLRKYEQTEQGARPVSGLEGGLCATCPHRFEEGGLIYEWIGAELLRSSQPIVLGEIGFLEDREGKKVGRIDRILVHPEVEQLAWCALEKQAVYFSGDSMTNEFKMLQRSVADELPYPAGRRRPDFRSSGPKRLMPQLQIKVPTLRRWGRKMAVVVDQPFFAAMGSMETVEHVSNGDIIWFVVGYEEANERMTLTKSSLAITTLETSVVGLTGGQPVSQAEFESQIRAKLPTTGE